MNIEIKTLHISNFKGIYDEMVTFHRNTVISGENGSGKTSVYDAFYWLISDKDSESRSEFGIRPLDKDNNPIEGLITKVTGILDIGGEYIELRKEQHERIVKAAVVGFTNKCWINDVPKKVGEFENYLANIITSERLKMLTDLRYFADVLPQTERRKILLDMTGKAAKPEGFIELLANLQNRTVDEQRARLREQRKDYGKEREGIIPRLDELNRGIEKYLAGGNLNELKAARVRVENEIKAVKRERLSLINGQIKRNEQLVKISRLKEQLAERERDLLSDTADVSGVLAEKIEIQKSITTAMEKIDYYEAEMRKYANERTDAQAHLQKKTEHREELRLEISELAGNRLDIVCYACQRQLPDNQIEQMKTDKADKIKELTQQAGTAAQQVGKQTKFVEEIDMQVGSAKRMLQEFVAAHKKLEKKSNERLVEIEEALQDRTKPEPDKDEKWLAIKGKIGVAEKAVKPSTEGVIASMENDRETKDEELRRINESLAQSDRLESDKERVSELEDKVKSLSQYIANCDKQLVQIADYKRAENILIEKLVNNKFQHTTFKLFKELLNGEIVDVCEPLYEGKPYPDQSAGEKIYTGIDCANTLSEHYDCYMPLFIDHIESLSLPVETECQTIKLLMVKGQASLVVEQEDE